MSELVARMMATQDTVKTFLHRPHKWGAVDCVIMARAHLENMGHRSLPLWGVIGTWGSEKQALRALSRAPGSEAGIPGVLDQLGFARIDPAFALTGDFVGYPEDSGVWGCALGIATGQSQALAMAHEHALIGSMSTAVLAWRIMPVLGN